MNLDGDNDIQGLSAKKKSDQLTACWLTAPKSLMFLLTVIEPASPTAHCALKAIVVLMWW